MEKICKNCAHWCICKSWQSENGVCTLHDDRKSEGEWEYEQLDNFRKYKVTCPFCKSYYIGNYDAYDDPEYFNFCPECGAKMKGGAE